MRKMIAILLAIFMLATLLAACEPQVIYVPYDPNASTPGGNSGNVNNSGDNTGNANNDAQGSEDSAQDSEDSAQDDANKKFKVAVVLTEYNEWNKNYEKSVKARCELWDWEYKIFDAKQDVNTQIDHVRQVISEGYDAMLIQAAWLSDLAPVVKEAAENGVIVIDHYGFSDDQVPGNMIYKCLFDQKSAGKLQAEKYIEMMGASGKVAIIAGLTGANNAMQRTAGFMEVLNKYPDIEIVATEYCDWAVSKAYTAAKNILTAHPDLTAFLVQDDGMARGVWDAIEAASKQDTCKIATQGFYDWSKDYIVSGQFLFTIAYPAEFFSSSGMDLIKAVHNGEQVNRKSYVNMEVVTVDNVYTVPHD